MLKEEDRQSVTHVDAELNKRRNTAIKQFKLFVIEIRWIISWKLSNGFWDFGGGFYSGIPRKFLNRFHLKQIFMCVPPRTILKMEF